MRNFRELTRKLKKPSKNRSKTKLKRKKKRRGALNKLTKLEASSLSQHIWLEGPQLLGLK